MYQQRAELMTVAEEIVEKHIDTSFIASESEHASGSEDKTDDICTLMDSDEIDLMDSLRTNNMKGMA